MNKKAFATAVASVAVAGTIAAPAMADETATTPVAEDLSAILGVGDTLALVGDLGAGKSTLARALTRAIADDAELEVPSPTFTLVQFYEGARLKVAHFDLYRLTSAEEAYEIGLDEALEDGAAVIEWPERLDGHLPPDRLDIEIAIYLAPDGGEARRARLTPAGAWEGRGLEF